MLIAARWSSLLLASSFWLIETHRLRQAGQVWVALHKSDQQHSMIQHRAIIPFSAYGAFVQPLWSCRKTQRLSPKKKLTWLSTEQQQQQQPYSQYFEQELGAFPFFYSLS